MTGPDDIDGSLPEVGQRAKLGRIVERFPHFWISAGAVGTITVSTDDLIALKMDEKISGAEEWDNEIWWTADLAALSIGSVPRRIAAAFRADAEILSGFDGTVAIDGTAGGGPI